MSATRRRTREQRKLDDAFYGGYCCALSAALYGDDGTSTGYLEAVEAVGRDDLLSYARRHGDIELPRIRAAIQHLKRQEKTNEWFASSRSPEGSDR